MVKNSTRCVNFLHAVGYVIRANSCAVCSNLYVVWADSPFELELLLILIYHQIEASQMDFLTRHTWIPTCFIKKWIYKYHK